MQQEDLFRFTAFDDSVRMQLEKLATDLPTVSSVPEDRDPKQITGVLSLLEHLKEVVAADHRENVTVFAGDPIAWEWVAVRNRGERTIGLVTEIYKAPDGGGMGRIRHGHTIRRIGDDEFQIYE